MKVGVAEAGGAPGKTLLEMAGPQGKALRIPEDIRAHGVMEAEAEGTRGHGVPEAEMEDVPAHGITGVALEDIRAHGTTEAAAEDILGPVAMEVEAKGTQDQGPLEAEMEHVTVQGITEAEGVQAHHTPVGDTTILGKTGATSLSALRATTRKQATTTPGDGLTGAVDSPAQITSAADAAAKTTTTAMSLSAVQVTTSEQIAVERTREDITGGIVDLITSRATAEIMTATHWCSPMFGIPGERPRQTFAATAIDVTVLWSRHSLGMPSEFINHRG